MTESCILTKGCGGIALPYHKNLKVTTVLNTASNRICGIQIQTKSFLLTVLGVYLPCSDQGLDCFREHLVELETLVSKSQHVGAVVVVGDVNSHIGSLVGQGERTI